MVIFKIVAKKGTNLLLLLDMNKFEIVFTPMELIYERVDP
tara:strand:+ start:164 stop:283 length:120 start_codon:yes stop_codon:yes gene_type:complete